MTVVTVNDLHLAADPDAHLAQAAKTAAAGNGDVHRLIVRCPDRQTDGVRALRAHDVAKLLQRYARIREIAVTEGGTIVAAGDVVKRCGEVAVWTGHAIGEWAPADITQRGLGGSETAAVRLAESFAAMGYTVTLYGQFTDDGMAGDVLLRDFREFDPTEPLHALVVFRQAAGIFDQRPNAEFSCLWLEDLPGLEGITPERVKNLDRIFTVSHWHKGDMENFYPFLKEAKDAHGRDIVAAARNGIVNPWFDHDVPPHRECRAVYSSSPDRGGDIMLELWPLVREQVPDAELILTYSRWYDICYQAFGATPAHDRMMELLEQPGVRRIEGGLGQKDLADLMSSSLMWVHPSWWTAGDQNRGVEFHETSCISCMEAQAAGCVVVASNWGALSENVHPPGTLIDGDPREVDGPWRKAFIDAVVRGLTNKGVQAQAQLLGPEMVRDMGWRGAAEQVAAMFPKRAVRSRA